MFDYNAVIDKYYPEGEAGGERALLRDVYLKHCRSVSALAIRIARERRLDVSEDDIEAAAMLHDIGIVQTDAAGIHCHGELPYIVHGVCGAAMLRSCNAPEAYARVAERHTGAGLTPEDVKRIGYPHFDSARSYMPESVLERLICYADKFYSKSGDMEKKSLERVRASMMKFGEDALRRFEMLHAEFSTGGEEG